MTQFKSPPRARCLLALLLSLSLLITSSEGHGGCSTKSRPLKELEVTQQKIEALKRLRSGIGCIGCITVDTYIYVIQGAIVTTNAIIQEQMKVLNSGFSRTPFTFKLIQANFVTDAYFNQNWRTAAETATNKDADPLALVAKYPRRGDYATLNLWFGGTNEQSSFATFPESGGLNQNPTDGVFVILDELPEMINCDETCSVLGTTAVHEVGHWLGLEHVFNSVTGKSCDPNDKNDFVNDTPQLANIKDGTNFQCPPDSTDTCPLLPGKDPIHNFMDYSSDACVNEFTPGQIQRMYYVWSIYRKSNEACSSGYKVFELEILTDEYGCELSWVLESTDGKFSWNTSPDQSSIDVYLPDSSITTQDICLDVTKDYVFTIYDNPNGYPPDGISPPGYYAIRYDGRLIKKNTAFGGASERTTFSGSLGGPPPTPGPISKSPTKAPTTSNGGFVCFSGTSLVQVKGNRGLVQMKHLKIGDLVLTAAASNTNDDTFEKVYSFGHRAAHQLGTFLKITTSSSASLELSSNHMVFVESGSAVPASSVKVGDKLVMANHELDTVLSISQVVRMGVYAPFTPSGTIVVNGIKASTFVSFQDSTFLKLGSISTGLSYQWMAHAFEFPHRVWCNQVLLSSSCKEEQYVDGISTWVVVPHLMARWFVRQHTLVKILLGVPVVIMFMTFWITEMMWKADLSNLFMVMMIITVALCLSQMSVVRVKSKVA